MMATTQAVREQDKKKNDLNIARLAIQSWDDDELKTAIAIVTGMNLQKALDQKEAEKALAE